MAWSDVLKVLASNTRTDGVVTYGSRGNVDFRSDGQALNVGNGVRLTKSGWEADVGDFTVNSNNRVSMSNGAAAEAVSSLLSSLF